MQQHAYAINKRAKWVSQIRQIAWSGWGVTPKYARKLYIGVTLPKILYGAEVWYTIAGSAEGERGKGGKVKVIKQLTKTQRAGMLAITGG